MPYYYQFSREAQLLLVDHSEENVEVFYNSDSHPYRLPLIGERPPYYTNPRYEPYYPVILEDEGFIGLGLCVPEWG